MIGATERFLSSRSSLRAARAHRLEQGVSARQQVRVQRHQPVRERLRDGEVERIAPAEAVLSGDRSCAFRQREGDGEEFEERRVADLGGHVSPHLLVSRAAADHRRDFREDGHGRAQWLGFGDRVAQPRRRLAVRAIGGVEEREENFLIDGQQPYALGEKAKDVYSLAPLPDSYWLTVKRDAAGKVEKLVVTQPEGEFGFKSLAGVASRVNITVDELMQRTIEAAGGEANWRKLDTRVSTFSIDLENQGVQGLGTSYSKAPNKSATETTITALGKTIATGFDYFDGTSGAEVYSFAPVDKYTGKRLEDIKLASDFYAGLDWKSKYKTIEIVSLGKVGDEEAYVVSFEPEKGSKFSEYYSTKTFLLLKREGSIPLSTSSVTVPYTITFSDYRDVDGIKIAFKTTNYTAGNGSIVTVLKDVKHNVEIADSVFKSRKL